MGMKPAALKKSCMFFTWFLSGFYLTLFLIPSRETSVTAGEAEKNSDIEEGGETAGTDIMQVECQDPLLACTYLGLPVLP